MQKILILSTPEDSSTNKVISWIRHYNFAESIIRIHPNDLISCRLHAKVSANYVELQTNRFSLNTSEIGVVWTRKWNDMTITIDIHEDRLLRQNQNEVMRHLVQDYSTLWQYVLYLINQNSHTKWLNHPNFIYPNKLIQLKIAQNVGLLTPESLLLNNCSEQIAPNAWITKSLSNCFFIRNENDIYCNYTSVVEPQIFNPQYSLNYLQSLIRKEFDLRVFYLCGKCFAIAILSQQNEKTRIDYRQYDHQRPNRVEPISLPLHLENAIDNFMHSMQLQTGSLDFIVDKDGNFIFLEVNPCGQYDIFNSCNFQPDRWIARKLLKMNDNE